MSAGLPPSASVAHAGHGGKLHAPAADRNAGALGDLIAQHAPKRGAALEIASGTGQHITHFAARLPGIAWQPSDISAERLASINAYAAEAALPNIAPAVLLNAAERGWSKSLPPQDLIVVINLLHLISDAAARAVLAEAAQALTLGGRFILYGPFKRGGVLTSAGDARFDADLRGADPAIGYKDDAWAAQVLAENHLRVTLVQEMPANNLAFIAERVSL
ncbi:MAG: DUF938 domain-containing protein [Sulfitobacter sp.]